MPLFGKGFPPTQSSCVITTLVSGITRLGISTPRHPRTSQKHGKGQAEDGKDAVHRGSLGRIVWDGQVGGDFWTPFVCDVSTCSVGWRRKSSKGGNHGGIKVSAEPGHRPNAENVPSKFRNSQNLVYFSRIGRGARHVNRFTDDTPVYGFRNGKPQGFEDVTMKAVLVEKYDAIDNIYIRDVEKPVVSGGQLLVRIQAVSLGFVDGLKVQGLYQTKDPLPFTLGMEFAGIVESAASNVTGFAPGTPVMGMARNGALAEYLTVPAAETHKMPKGVSPEVGASLSVNYLTALYALDPRAKLRTDEQLLVLGAAGGTGTAAIQIGKLLGARVIAAASTEEKRDFAKRCGADEVLDYTQPNWRDTLKELTEGQGADVIFDPVGGAVSEQAFRSIAWNGRHVVVGFTSGKIPSLRFNLPLLKGGVLMGVDLAQIEQREPEVHKAVLEKLYGWLESKAFEPVIGRIFDFKDYREAIKTIQNRSALGKMVVRINGA